MSVNTIDAVYTVTVNSDAPIPTPGVGDNGSIKVEKTVKEYPSVWGNWFGFIQNTGLIVSSEFAKTTLKQMIYDQNIVQNAGIPDKALQATRNKLLSNLATGVPVQYVDLLNPDNAGVDSDLKYLSKCNPLNFAGTHSIRLLNELLDDSMSHYVEDPTLIVQSVLGRMTGKDNFNGDTEEHIMDELKTPIIHDAEENPYTVRRILKENYDYLANPTPEDYDVVTGANEILLLVIFAEFMHVTQGAATTQEFNIRKKVYTDAVSKIIASIIQKKFPKKILDEIGEWKYTVGDCPQLSKWFSLAFTMPSFLSKKRRNDTVENVVDIKSTGESPTNKPKLENPPTDVQV
jgi:hypothetical protein